MTRVLTTLAILLPLLACGLEDRSLGVVDEGTGEGEGSGGDGDGDGQVSTEWIYDDSCFNPMFGDGFGERCPSTGGMVDGGGGSSTPDPYCQECTCLQACTSDADCASPEGTAEGKCREGSCWLDCAGGRTCPGGRTCVDRGEWQECVFASDDEFLCSSCETCTLYTDEETCNSHVSPNGYGKCQWIVEEIHDDDSCVPATNGPGFCVRLGPSAGCNTDSACTANGPRVYYTDYGAGTYGLWTIDDCNWRPELPGEKTSDCDFSNGFGLPLLCECACD
jgi:hypothetical protein